MPQLSSSNRSQLRYKLEGTYPTNFGVPQSGNGTNLNMTGESFDYTVKTEESKTIRSDRQVPDNIQVSASPQGGFNWEFQYKEYDPFIEATLQNEFQVYGTLGVSGALTLTLASNTITASSAPTGADAFTTLRKGQWFTIKPPSNASDSVRQYLARRAYRISPTVAPTSTVITLASETPLVTGTTGTSMVGANIRSSYLENGSLMKSYTLEMAHDDVGVFREYAGMILSKMDVSLTVGSIVTGTFDFMGRAMTLEDTTQMGTANPSQTFTLANATRGIFDIFENGVSIGVNTYIKSAKFSIDNSLRGQEAVGFFGNAGVAAGTMRVSGSLEVYFADKVYYNKFLNDKRSAVAIPIMDNEGNGYVFVFPSIKYKAGKINASGLDQDNMLSMEFMAVLDPDSSSPTFQKSVVIYRVGAASDAVVVASSTRPRYGAAAALLQGNTAGLDTLFAAMTQVGSNGGKAATFAVSPSAGQYGYYAVLAAAGASGVTFTDNIGTGGWSGAGLAGNNTGSSPSVSTVHMTYTDADSNNWFIYRQDYSATAWSGSAS